MVVVQARAHRPTTGVQDRLPGPSGQGGADLGDAAADQPEVAGHAVDPAADHQ